MVKPLFTLLLILSGLLQINAQGTAKEHEVKAAFIFNFLQFTEWPNQAFPRPGEPFIIGILGDNPFGKSLETMIAGESLKGHPITIRKYKDADEAAQCHILFINLDRNRLSGTLEMLKGKPILTIGEIPDFASHGGMIGFTKENNKIRFQINYDVAKSTGIVIDSKLLRLAQIVQTKNG